MQEMNIKGSFISKYVGVAVPVLYAILFLLSSGEVFVDVKNLLLLSLFTLGWAVLYFAGGCKKRNIIMYFISVFIGLLVPLMSYAAEPLFLQRLMKDFLLWYSLPLSLGLLPAVIRNRKLGAAIAVLLFSFALFPLLLMLGYYLIFDIPVSFDSILAILQSNAQESKEFLYSYLNVKIALTVLAVGLLLSYFGYFVYNFNSLFLKEKLRLKKNRLLAATLMFALFVSTVSFAQKAYFWRTFMLAWNLNAQMEKFAANSEVRKQRLIEAGNLLADNRKGNYALVIGETHASSNVSAYGYARRTTPWLENAVKQEALVLLKNAFSNAAQTNTALEYALTAKNQYNSIQYADAYTITEAAQAAGFRVVWISNQVDDNIVGLVGHQADEQYWINQNKNDTWLRQKNEAYDGKIIDCLKNLQAAQQKTLYVINLIGSHASYDCRYPEEFNKWDEAESLLNAYDNSLLYNDYVMSQLHEIFLQKLGVDVMLYFADHGEELKLKYCHGNDYFIKNYKQHPSVREIVKIPVYISFSESFSKTHEAKITNLRNNREKYFSNDMVYDTLLGLMGIRGACFDERYDISSQEYGMTKEELKTMHGRVSVSELE